MNFSFPLRYRIKDKKIIKHNLFSPKYRNIDCKIESYEIAQLQMQIFDELKYNVNKKNKFLIPFGIYIEPTVLQ